MGSGNIWDEQVRDMSISIAFCVGCITFVLMMVLKIPMKKITGFLAHKLEPDEDDAYILYKRLNGVIILLTIMIAIVCYYLVSQWLGIENFKFCCSLKAGFIAIALYALYEQWFGED